MLTCTVRLIFACAIIAIVSHSANAFAQLVSQVRSYLIDLNTYRATDIGNLGGFSTRAHAMNGSGQIIGREDIGPFTHGDAFITEADGKGIRKLPDLPSLLS